MTIKVRSIDSGSIIRIWHENNPRSVRRGHSYVPVGIDEEARKVHLLKVNALNKDGTIHKAVKAPHKTLPYVRVGTGKVVKGVTYIDKTNRDLSQWGEAIAEMLPSNVKPLTDETFRCVVVG